MAGAGLVARLRSSARLSALYRGLRGFVLGPPRPPSTVTPPPPKPASDFGIDLLRRVTPVRSPRPGYRLNLVVPAIDAARTFGGIRTALDVFEAVGAGVGERRIVSLGGSGSAADDAIGAYVPVDAGADPEIALQFVAHDGHGGPLAVRPGDVFVATFWTTAEAVGRIRRWQASIYGSAPDRFGYVIQDYEPGFYPSSAHSVLALATYADASETIAVFNTSMLRDAFHTAGITFGQEFAFEPRLLPALRAAMTLPALARSRTIVVYGRPDTPRNAFPAIIDGLATWRATDPGAAGWRVVSVGQGHPEIDLGGGVLLQSLGKLSLGDYAALLRGSAIGVSLMVSPHPSYPPLEMAHLGMLVVTNRYGAKDLSAWHPNIRSVDDLSAEAIATLLSELCRLFDADPGAGGATQPIRPDFISDAPPFPFADRLAADLRESAARAFT